MRFSYICLLWLSLLLVSSGKTTKPEQEKIYNDIILKKWNSYLSNLPPEYIQGADHVVVCYEVGDDGKTYNVEIIGDIEKTSILQRFAAMGIVKETILPRKNHLEKDKHKIQYKIHLSFILKTDKSK